MSKFFSKGELPTGQDDGEFILANIAITLVRTFFNMILGTHSKEQS